jgi:hypothetical protein
VNADAVGAAVLFPGVRPAAVGEGGAGVLDLRSRAGGGTGRLRGVGELSLFSARAALDQTVGGGRGAWMVAGRRSYLDVATRGAADPDDRIPYAVSEVVLRGDWHPGRAHAIEVSAFRSRDHIADRSAFDDPSPGAAPGATGSDRWGNTAARITHTGPATLGALGAVRLRHTAGVTAYGAAVTLVDSASPPGDPARDQPVRAAVTYATFAGEAAPWTGDGTPARWTLGYAAVVQQARTAGRLRAAYLGERDTTWTARATTLPMGALWGERRLTPTPRLTVAAGLRVEAGAPVRGTGPVRAAPRVTARYTPGDGATVLSAGLGRHVQYVQGAPGLVGGSALRIVLSPVPNWMLASRDTPALVADVATVGWERWTTSGWDVTANAYARRSAGVLGPDLRPGPIAGRALAVAGTEQAGGVEVGARRLVGRWTGSANYALARAVTGVRSLRYASAEDQRHVLHATTMVRAGRGVRLGAAYSVFSGAPFTGLVPADAAPAPGTLGAPNAHRLPAFARLDLSAEWSFAVRAVRAGAYLQVVNVPRAAERARPRWACRAGGRLRRCGPVSGRRRLHPGPPHVPVRGTAGELLSHATTGADFVLTRAFPPARC